jgi:filamentous hemagglutinin family protein
MKLRPCHLPQRQSVIVLAVGSLLACNPAAAQTARNWAGVVPLPSGPSGQSLVSATIRQPQVVAGRFNPYTVSGNTATITQNDAAGILQWGSFDIAPGYTVSVVQPSATAVLLNKVDGGAFDNKTAIDGILKANGQVYIYNPNGIIFGKTSQVNVNSLVATTLKIDDTRFLSGLLAPSSAPNLSADATATHVVVDPLTGTKTVVAGPGSIEVEGARNAAGGIDQAQISAANGGRVLLAAPTVSNSGRLSAPDGQVALAAGGSVYLASPSDARMRGLLIEVNNANLATGSSTATNESLGKILVERGNATLVGLAVNQMGTVSAKTSVEMNGSIFLRARDAATKGIDSAPVATRGGDLVLGPDSVTQILPTLDDKTKTAGTTTFNASWIDLTGKTIHLENNASVVAPSGIVDVTARAVPSLAAANGPGRVYMEAGSTIDVAGTTSTELAMEDNVITVELRGSELADSPLQRNSALRGQKVNIDIRKGTPLANVQGWIDLVEHSVGERTAAGGKVTFRANSDVILAAGATVNVSGGKVDYKGGNVATTQLMSAGRVVDIGSASADRIYDGFYKPVAGPRNFEAGYSEGRSAGTIVFDAANLVLRGNLLGKATPGVKQRDVSSSTYPKGGELIIGNDETLGNVANYLQFDYQGNVALGGNSTKTAPTPGFLDPWASNPLKSTLDLSPISLESGGFSRIRAYTLGDIVADSELRLAPGGEITLAAQNGIAISADISAPGGKLSAASALSSVTVGNGIALDAAGLWSNDRSSATAMDAAGNAIGSIVNSGGSIALSGMNVEIGDGATFDVSAGAWQNRSGKISAGSGGSIAIDAKPESAVVALDLIGSGRLLLGNNVDFLGYGQSTGGKLRLSGRNVTIGAAPVSPLDLSLNADWFSRGGFASFDIRAAGNLTVAPGAAIRPAMQNWFATRDTAAQAGGRMSDAFALSTLPLAGVLGSRNPSSISLSAAAQMVDGSGRLWIQPGASIVTDPGGSVTLAAGRQLTVDGRVTAPGGAINAYLTAIIDTNATYRPERSVWLGSGSLLDVGGTAARTWVDAKGMSNGELLNGGKIQIGRLDDTGKLSALAGYVVLDDNATLNLAGVSANMTLPNGSRGGNSTRSVASAGGSLDIRAREGLLLAGNLNAAGGDASVAGGSLNLVLDRENVVGNADFPALPRNLVIARQKPNAGTAAEGIVPAGLHADAPIVGYEGTGYVLADTLNNAGFDRIALKSQDAISFDAGGTSLALQTRAGLTLDAPLLKAANVGPGGAVNLASVYARIGNADWRYQAAAAANLPSGGNARLNVNADTLDIVGSSVLQGFGDSRFTASNDIRLVGQADVDLTASLPAVLPVIHAKGALSGAGAMRFTAGQIYPTTLSEFTLNATGSGNSIGFYGNGAAAVAPLSAAGTLSVNAEDIVQRGTVRAPFGRIDVNAANTLTYGAGSLTSVAGTGRVPFGVVNNGRDWLYDFGNGNTVAINSSASNGIRLPQKAVVSSAKSVQVESGAVIDLAGGGELYAYEFTPGPGGSVDVLAKPSGAALPTTFAILPGFTAGIAPQDFQNGQEGGLNPGDRIYLSGIPGLAAGFYTLLPAHYALLPGGYAVTAASGTRDMAAAGNYSKLDGSWVVAGYRGSTASADSRYSGFMVSSSAQVRTRSEFVDYLGDNFFAGTATAKQGDGGRVAFAATETLSLDGLIKLGAIAGGKRGIADISVQEITVVADRSQDTGTALKLVASDLVALGADSLMLGGLRDEQSDGVHVTVQAQKVTLANDAAHPLTGREIILAAKDEVRLRANSDISASGVPGGSTGDLIVDGSGAAAEGALLRVSGGSQVAVVRNAGPSPVNGKLTIEAGASVGASGSMNLDATNSLDNRGVLKLGDGGALSIGANRISFGATVPDSVDGLRFDTSALGLLNSIADLSLTSYTTFDLYGNAALGRAATADHAATRRLSLRGAGIQSYGTADASFALTADTVRFDGGGTFTTATAASVASGNLGALNVTANKDIEIGSNAFAVKGLKTVALSAPREMRAVGAAGALEADHDMTVTAGLITGATGADATVQAGGKLTLTRAASPLAPVTTDALGAKLSFIGSSVASDAAIIARAGQIALRATGTDGVHVSGGSIDAGGYAKAFGSTVAYAPGGSITLDGGIGDVKVDAVFDTQGNEKVVLDVSATGADAGLITVSATHGGSSQAVLNGKMKGDAFAGASGTGGTMPKQGRFSLDADRVVRLEAAQTAGLDAAQIAQLEAQSVATRFGALNDRLNATGFTESRQFRVREGDVTLASGNSLVAHDVQIAADDGNVTLGGTIDATGPKGGSIQVYAAAASAGNGKGRVQIESTARLDASATQAASAAAGSTGDGGRIVIGTATTDGSQPANTTDGANIAVSAGARFNVAGSGAGQDGSILLRAPRLSGGNDVALAVTDNTTLTDVAAVRDGADNVLRHAELVVEGYKVYSSTGDVSIGTAADTVSNSALQAATTAGAVATAGKMYADSNGFLSDANKSAMQTRLGTSSLYRAGVEVRAAGDITVRVNESAANPQDRGWNLNAWRFGTEAGALTLRAAGNLVIGGSISDGFVKPATRIGMPGWQLDPAGGSSWSYRIAGGADLTAANPLSVKPASATGDVKLTFARTNNSGNDQAVALVRTGSGRIDVAAGRDVILDTLNPGTANALGATIYTSGQHVATQSTDQNQPDYLPDQPKKQTINTLFAPSNSSTSAEFSQGGGGIAIAASRNVVGAATSQLINNWLFRRGRTAIDATGATVFAQSTGAIGTTETLGTAWWSRYDYFNQGIATFAGGDITVNAGGGITDISVSAVSNGQVPGSAPGPAPVERGGGDIKVVAGGDIRGGSYYVQKGQASLRTEGSFSASSRTVLDSSIGGTVPLRPVLALGDGYICVIAQNNVDIESVLNPTLTRQSTSNAAKITGTPPANYTYFSTYGEGSGVDLTSLTGNVLLSNNSVALAAASGTAISNGLTGGELGYRTMYQFYPGSLSVAALNGNITYQHGFSLSPSPIGQLELLAGGSVRSDFLRNADGGIYGAAQPVVMLDVNPSTLPNVNAPRTMTSSDFNILQGSGIDGLSRHTSTGLHNGDTEPVRIVALTGDISGENYFGNPGSSLTLVAPKRAEIVAGKDIVDFGFKIQQMSTSDVTLIEAGGNFIDSTNVALPSAVKHSITGPGRADFLVSGDLDLGNGAGIVSRGNLDNPYLPTGGASINITVGAHADYVGALRHGLTVPGLDPSSMSDSQLRAYVNAHKTEMNDRFFALLADASGATTGAALDLAKFDAVIADLFPAGAITGGNANVFGSQVKTEQGGAIDLFAPGGSVYAGLVNLPAYLKSKSAADLGIFTIRGGEIRALVKKDFMVNQGRVFTLGGGDITLVSQFGNIDAGRGAKTSTSAPPPLLTTDAQGNTKIDISGSISGSGIATLKTGPDVPASNVYPIAPRGIFDAGDAGVRSTGTVNIVAQTVLNANNIAASGSISGAHTVDSSGMAAPAAAPSNAAVTKTDAIAGAANPDATQVASLSVELLGYGGEGQQAVTQDSQNSRPSPVDCKDKQDCN